MMQENLSEEEQTRSYSFLIDESNKTQALNRDVSSTVYQQVKFRNFDPEDKEHKKIQIQVVGQLESVDGEAAISDQKRGEIDILLRLFHYEEIVFEPMKLSNVFTAE